MKIRSSIQLTQHLTSKSVPQRENAKRILSKTYRGTPPQTKEPLESALTGPPDKLRDAWLLVHFK
jgi:hypothetical protein